MDFNKLDMFVGIVIMLSSFVIHFTIRAFPQSV